MQQIASGTHNYQQLNEIMPMIYKRFTDKTAEEWRQIYKVRLQYAQDNLLLTIVGPSTTGVSRKEWLRTCRG